MIVYLLLLLLGIGAALLVDRHRRVKRGLPATLGDQIADGLSPVAPEQERAAWAQHRGGFDVVLRGYRMDQVDERLAELEEELRILRAESDR